MNEKLLAEFIAAGIKKLVENVRWTDVAAPGDYRTVVARIREIADTIEQCGERLTSDHDHKGEDQ